MDYWYYECCCPTAPEELGPSGPSGDCCSGISGAHVNADGELEIVLTNDEVINCGNVVGPSGPSGPIGWTGASGIGFTASSINDSGNLILTTTDGQEWNAGSVLPTPKVITSQHNGVFTVPNGYNTFVNSDGDIAMTLTLPTTGNYIGEIFTISHLSTQSGITPILTVTTTNTSMTSQLQITNAMGGAAFVWNGHFWQLITQV